MGKFKKIEVSSLLVDSRYSTKSIDYIINIQNNGIKVNINNLNNIRLLSKLEKIKTYYEYFSSFSKVLNIKNDDDVRWNILLGDNKNKEYLRYLKNSIQSTLFKSLLTEHF